VSTPVPYQVISGLDDVYFEDSYVLAITARPGRVVISLDLVLTPQHPEYRPPAPGEQHCYRRAELVFEGVRQLWWRSSNAPPASDASGELDLGNIDSFTVGENRYHLEGDWGSMDVDAAHPSIRLSGRD
jgi:hypothetical protein